jgi:pilus assembly protein Flp/PilA
MVGGERTTVPVDGGGNQANIALGAMRFGRSFFRDQSGATAVEYGLMMAAVAAILLAILQLMGERLNSARSTIGGAGASTSGKEVDAGTFIRTRDPNQNP